MASALGASTASRARPSPVSSTRPANSTPRVATSTPLKFVVLLALVGVVLTCAYGYGIARKKGVYFAETEVLFLPPRSGVFPNSLANISGGLTGLAGTVGRLVQPHPPAAHVVSPTVTLAVQGIRNGWSVSLPNDGGQFADNFDQQLLDVQVVGPNAAEVKAKMQSLVASINTNLTALQDRGQVALVNRVTTTLNPSQTEIVYDNGRRPRALAATIGLGLALTLAAVVFARRTRLRLPRLRRRLAVSDAVR